MPKAIAIGVASCFATGGALALPYGFSIVNGQVFVNANGKVLNVTNSPGAIINWQGFSIAANEITRFIQQSASSTVLNRVVGIDPSIILGTLQSNGRVFLINPNGVVFGSGATVDVAGLVASTLNLSNADFLAGRMRFTDTPGAGSVINQGTITTPTGGQVYLIAPNVQNHGIISSAQGEVILAAGKTVEIVDSGTPNLRVELTASDNEALNVGQIIANSGKIGIYAGLIRNSGVIRADGVVVGANGEIMLKATGNTTLDAGSIISASGAQGGNITVQSGDTTLVAGNIEATGSSGTGGNVQVLGNLVGLTGNAAIDASGQTGGGVILVGGDTLGGNPGIQNAQFTTVASGANLMANAGHTGDGGRVIVWSDDTTRFDGHISARGGTGAGDGGFAEISGKQHLALTGYADLRAPNGRAGMLLLDPGTVTICHLGGSCATTQTGLDIFSDDYISTQLGFGSLTITTAGASAGPQDINFVDNSINITWQSSTGLNFLAGNNINQLGAIAGPNGEVDFIATNGNLTIGGSVNVGGYAILRATNGAITNNSITANTVTAGYLEAAAANGINLDTAVNSYVQATNSTSGNIMLRNSTQTAIVQTIHNAGGTNIWSGLGTDNESNILTGGVVIHGEWPGPLGSGGQSPFSALNPVYPFSTAGGGVMVLLNSPRANTSRTDPYLYVLDGNNNVIRSDDDGGQGYAARIDMPGLAAGNYSIVAATYRSGQITPFDLSIGGAATALPRLPPPQTPPVSAGPQNLVQAFNTVISSTNNSVSGVVADDQNKSDQDNKRNKDKKDNKDEKTLAKGLELLCR